MLFLTYISLHLEKILLVIFLLNSYFILNFDVLLAGNGNRYADGNDIRLLI